MARPDVEFDRPPVVEVVLGAQFAPLPNLTAAHLGWYWKQYLGPEWNTSANAPPLPDQFERFGDQRRWVSAGPMGLRFSDGSDTGRAKFTRDRGERMIQAQPTRFHYNWQKREGDYPRYTNVRREFDECFRQFSRFVEEASVGPLALNQWELTYVNLIPEGSLWRSPADWSRVLPGLFPPLPPLSSAILEAVGGEWHFELPPQKGRLHVAVRSGRRGDPREPVLALQLTARGPADDETGLKGGLDLGHEAIVATFAQLTSEEAHSSWGIHR